MSRQEAIADAALALLAERGMRGLTHRAVDETAGLPQGSTSNRARTRAALLELAVQRLAVREGHVLDLDELPRLNDGLAELADVLALVLHRYLTGPYRKLLVARYELAMEATRRPELREVYDRAGAAFRGPLVELMRAAGSDDPERHALSLVAWTDGMMFTCTAGSASRHLPTRDELRAGYAELLRGMLASERPPPPGLAAPPRRR